MQPDYKMLALLLTGNHVERAPAQVHDMLTGQLCSGSEHPVPDDLEHLLEQAHSFPPVIVKLLERLLSEAASQLANLELQFHPLLPPDDASLEERVEALGLWCDGFMTGFAAGFVQPESVLSGEAREILQDFGQLADVSENTDGLSDQDEVDFMELVEYVRVAAVTLYEQLASHQPESKSDEDNDAGPGSEFIH